MTSTLRHVAFAALALTGLAGAAFVGCAESPTFPEDEETFDNDVLDASKKPSAKDSGKGDDDGPVVDVDADTDDEDADTTDDAGDEVDGGADAKDSGTDAGKDAGTGGGKDAGTDAGTGGGKDAGTDAGVGGGQDGGTDAGPVDQDGGASKPSQGEIVISEVLFNPSNLDEPATEWFEVYNAAASARTLSGLTIKDKSRTHVIGAGVVVQPGAYAVLVRSHLSATNGPTDTPAGVQIPAGVIVYDYGTGVKASEAIQLGNDSKADLTLLDGATEIARAHYGALGLSGTKDASIQLHVLDYASADVKANWCVSANAWAGHDKGTPGTASDCN